MYKLKLLFVYMCCILHVLNIHAKYHIMKYVQLKYIYISHDYMSLPLIDLKEDFKFDTSTFEKYLPVSLRTEISQLTFDKINENNNKKHIHATRHLNGRYQPYQVIKDIPQDIMDIKEIYELNFLGLQYLFNLVEKYNVNPKSISVLVWGCGLCTIDYYLDKIGFNVLSYDNWSQIERSITEDILKSTDNNINLVDKVSDLYDEKFQVIIDTGNFMTDRKIIGNPNIKIIFTWAVKRLDEGLEGTPNLDYLMDNFTRIDFPSGIIFVKNDHIK